MARLIGIDYGTKKVGIAVTDPLQIIVNPLITVPTGEVIDFLLDYCREEEVEAFVVGLPVHKDGRPAQIAHLVTGFIRKLKKLFPEKSVISTDEMFSSVEAKEIILKSGLKKKKRSDKSIVDKVAAAIILERYMNDNR